MANQILLLEIQPYDSENQKLTDWCYLEDKFLTLACQLEHDTNWQILVKDLELADSNCTGELTSDGSEGLAWAKYGLRQRKSFFSCEEGGDVVE